MKKETMLTELERQLEKQLIDIDFAIDWNTKQHSVEVIIVLFAENKEGDTIEDEGGVVTEENVIEFEDAVLFYSQDKEMFDEEDYLAMLPFDRKKGISKAYIQAFAGYLNEVATEGQDDLLDFLSDDSIDVFELKWNDDVFAERIATIDTKQAMPYPKF
ncbi:MAG: DUF3013 family protein [Vagococcus sp.]